MRRFLSLVVAMCGAANAAMAADDAATVLAERLTPHVGQTLDLVELGTGRRLVRPTLEGLTERGDAPAFGHMLMHETSHGLNHRWISPERLPSLLNDGIAEWVGTQVAPECRQVPPKASRALGLMRAPYRVSLADLVRTYGKAIGIPDLTA